MPKALVVEDDADLAYGVRLALERAGWEVGLAGTGPEGLRVTQESEPDVLVLDIGLPGLDGLQVCRELRRTSRVPILFLTARSAELDRVLGLEMGGDDYLTKPFSIRELVARVSALHRRAAGGLAAAGVAAGLATVGSPAGGAAAVGSPAGGAERVIRVHDLTIYPERRKLRRRDAEIYLTNTEFSLLLTLARQPGKIFSRDQLLEAIWEGGGRFVVEHVVNVHLRNLREKLEDDPDHPALILTVRGAGYKLRELPTPGGG